MSAVSWKSEPDEHDCPAATAYLSPIADAAQTDDLVGRLKTAAVAYHKAEDILRAATPPLLTKDNPHVAADLKKIAQNAHLSPAPPVRGDLSSGVPPQITDGYHRVRASYYIDENTDIPCHLVGQGRSR